MSFEAIKARIDRDPIAAYDQLMAGNGDDLAKLPAHVHKPIAEFVLLGVPMGNFLTAVFCNDLRRSVQTADKKSLKNLAAFGVFLSEGAPACAVGSPEIINAWITRGGLLQMSKMAA
ncbi:MAG: hypothetical protein AAFR68_08270 [Pseudomonadota bacterium]